MNWNEVICPNCGLVNDYTITEKANNNVCTCNGCKTFLGNKPKGHDACRIPFGKYKDRLIHDIALTDVPYLLWYYRECREKLSNGVVKSLEHYLKIKQ